MVDILSHEQIQGLEGSCRELARAGLSLSQLIADIRSFAEHSRHLHSRRHVGLPGGTVTSAEAVLKGLSSRLGVARKGILAANLCADLERELLCPLLLVEQYVNGQLYEIGELGRSVSRPLEPNGLVQSISADVITFIQDHQPALEGAGRAHYEPLTA